MNPAFASAAGGTKRRREGNGDSVEAHSDGPFGKKARPTLNAAGDVEPWRHDSVINTPTTSSQQPKYDSDDQSSMVSEPGSPQELVSSADEMDTDMDDLPSFSQSPEDHHTLPNSQPPSSSPWRERIQTRNRVSTPFTHTSRAGVRPMQQLRTGINYHMRQRHPQENFSSDGHLEVPSPIDEDEVPTPPSAAEAAGSQLSMLTVNDMDIETADLPAITVEHSRSLHLDRHDDGGAAESLHHRMGGGVEGVVVRKQRLRSGAQSNGSVSPARAGAAMGGELAGSLGGKRGLSVGYRADCEKCRTHVPGHMNHFVM
ncbi:hypothetical protein LTR36_008210 [Oleoguttula mirabilis]|uniref:Uncharacterized protein n=1 Tax=Oleoguttula mirabilis TaxID=1507867 RepID=A0AAV9J869_9PEZI|nr:hypothetical protein LTR36_008210 [Oleoguttula mirabilis]